MLIEALFIGHMMVTAYQSKPEQTDASPFFTSIGEHVNPHGIAVSRDLLCPLALSRNMRIRRHLQKHCHLTGRLHYGDLLYIPTKGFRKVNDTMNARHRQAVDLWVHDLAEEKANPPVRLKVYFVKEPFYGKEKAGFMGNHTRNSLRGTVAGYVPPAEHFEHDGERYDVKGGLVPRGYLPRPEKRSTSSRLQSSAQRHSLEVIYVSL